MEKKYEFTGVTQQVEGRTLHRIRAVRSFGDVKEGQLGGWIEKEENLSHDGFAWVGDEAMVYDNARVYENARLSGEARAAWKARIHGVAWVKDKAKILGESNVYGHCRIEGDAYVNGKAEIYGSALVSGQVAVIDSAVCRGNAWVHSGAAISRNAVVEDNRDYIVFRRWWSDGQCITWTRSNNMWRDGCTHVEGVYLVMMAYSISKENGREYDRIVRYVEAVFNAE